MRGIGKRVAILLLAATAAGCQTYYKQFDLEVSPSALKRSVEQTEARYVVADGSWIFVDAPVDFGDAICGRTICVWKADIRGVHFVESHDGLPSPEMILVAPIFAVATFGLIQRSSGNGQASAPPGVADLMPACAQIANPAPPQGSLTSEHALAEWAWENQRHVSPPCALEASLRFDGDEKGKGVRLAMFATARGAWASARCNDAQIGHRLVPVRAGERLPVGDPEWIKWAREIIADPATYADDVIPAYCEAFGGVAPASEWEERKQMLMARLDPFSRDPFVYYGALAQKIPPDDNPHPLHNRRMPSIARPGGVAS